MTVLAHSLGNMLVSSAAVDHGLQYDRYYMLNAAVPTEAYDQTAYEPNMVDKAWTGVDVRFRASRRGAQFGEGDFRRGLSWKGRCYLPVYGFIGLWFANYADDAECPLFTPFREASLMTRAFDGRVDPVLRARMQGDAIPAESFAAGANAIGNVSQISNYNMPQSRDRGWPRFFSSSWKHSDLKNVALMKWNGDLESLKNS